MTKTEPKPTRPRWPLLAAVAAAVAAGWLLGDRDATPPLETDPPAHVDGWGEPVALAAADDRLWVAFGPPPAEEQPAQAVGGIARLNPDRGDVEPVAEIPRLFGIAVATPPPGPTIWAVRAPDQLLAIDADTTELRRRIRLPDPVHTSEPQPTPSTVEVAATDQAVWVVSGDVVAVVDPASGDTDLVELPGDASGGIAARGPTAWIGHANGIARVDALASPPMRLLEPELADGELTVADVALANDRLWAAGTVDGDESDDDPRGAIIAIDPDSGELRGHADTPPALTEVAVANGVVWARSPAQPDALWRTTTGLDAGLRARKIEAPADTPTSLQGAHRALWTLDAERPAVLRLDARTGQRTDTLALPTREAADAPNRVDVPDGWKVADDDLTPQLASPREVLTAGTGPFPAGGDTCHTLPQRAMNAFDADGAMVTIQAGGDTGLRPKPARWQWDDGSDTPTERCLDDPGAEHRLFTFRLHGQPYHAYITLGRHAPPQRRAEALDVLASFGQETDNDNAAPHPPTRSAPAMRACPDRDPVEVALPDAFAIADPTPVAASHLGVVRAGEQIVVWGQPDDTLGAVQAAIWTPADGAWTCLSHAPVEPPSDVHPPMAWTGEDVIVAGANGGTAALDPDTGRWRELPALDLASLPPDTLAADDDRVVAAAQTTHTWELAVLPAGEEQWEPLGSLAEPPVDADRATWTLTPDALVMAGMPADPADPRSPPTVGAAFDLNQRQWRQLPDLDLPSRSLAAAPANGEIIVADYTLASAAYDPNAHTWRELTDLPLRHSECVPEATGHRRLVLLHYCRQLALYHADADTWQPLLVADNDDSEPWPEPDPAVRLAAATPVEIDGKVHLIGVDLPQQSGAIVRVR